MNLSVILCTYNRAGELRRTLESFCALAIPPALRWELIVVDNNSTDNTRSVADGFRGRLPLRCVFEPRQGLSAARNHGVRDATGEWIVFTDDDVDVDPAWLAQLWTAANAHPEASFLGGKVLPHWETEPPRWLAENSATLLPGVTMHYDLGDAERFLSPEDDLMFFGANMAFLRRLLVGNAPFQESLGRQGADLIHGEESALMKHLLESGQQGLYVPGAVVRHHNPPTRMTERYVRQWFKGYGVTRVRNGEARLGASCCGLPMRSVRRVLINAVKYGLFRWTAPASVWLRAEVKMATACGVIAEYRRRARTGE